MCLTYCIVKANVLDWSVSRAVLEEASESIPVDAADCLSLVCECEENAAMKSGRSRDASTTTRSH